MFDFNRHVKLLSFRSVITHNIAQSLVANPSYDMYPYLNQWTKVLLEEHEYTLDEVNDIIIYAWGNAQVEVEIIKAMQAKGIRMNVSGHGGSAINPLVLAEMTILQHN